MAVFILPEDWRVISMIGAKNTCVRRENCLLLNDKENYIYFPCNKFWV